MARTYRSGPGTFNPEHAPVLGTNITEGVSLAELMEFQRTRALVLTDGTWANSLAKRIKLLPTEDKGEADVSTDRS